MADAGLRCGSWTRFRVTLCAGISTFSLGSAFAADLADQQDAVTVDIIEPAQSITIVSDVTPSTAHVRWARETYVIPDKEFGYEKIEFVLFDMDHLMAELRKNPLYLAALGDDTPVRNVPPRAVDLWLTFFGQAHPLKIGKVSIDTDEETEFVNLRGHIADGQDTGFGSIPGPYSWRLHINAADASVVGQIDTTSHQIVIQPTPDYRYTMVAWVSRQNLAKFPPID